MNGFSGARLDGLEDQIRNMILSGPSPSPTVQPAAQQSYAILPRNGHNPHAHPPHRANPQWHQNGPPNPQYHQQGRGRSNGTHAGTIHQQSQQSHGRGRQAPSQYRAYAQQPPVDPNTFHRRAPQNFGQRPQQPRQLYQPDARGPIITSQPQWRMMQAEYLESIAAREVPLVEMNEAERDEKDAFRKELEAICHEVCDANPARRPKVSIECFGSLQSGFASAGSDMDLVTVVQDDSPAAACFSLFEDDLPRALEMRLLQQGYGAHLLTRTRVPIIKVCQKPGSNLLSRLREEREKWDGLENEQKYPHLHKEEDEHAEDDASKAFVASADNTAALATVDANGTGIGAPEAALAPEATVTTRSTESGTSTDEAKDSANSIKEQPKAKREPWTRERKAGPLDFPKIGIGIQSDINFFNPLGIHNTHLLRCYSLCDPRVRPMVLFVKSWAKRRKINSSYSGTLSSYGYVLMVLHYLMNVTRPAVLPNLQQPWRPNPQCTPQGTDRMDVDGCEVDFWRKEDEILAAVQAGQMSNNHEPLGSLLAGFFQYYSSQGGSPQFHWMGEVLSLRSPGGLMTKEQKGWVKAKTEQGEGKQVQHRYLFAIEDPFELTHNVARTVTHNGIVAIRDEFRRASRILRAVSNNRPSEDGELFDEMVELPPDEQPTDAGRTLQLPGQFRQVRPPPQQQRASQAPNLAVSFKSLNVKDADSFPALASPKPAPAPQQRFARPMAYKSKQGKDFGGEISGDRAKAYLEDVRRKKAEEAAAKTASGVAESVLGP